MKTKTRTNPCGFTLRASKASILATVLAVSLLPARVQAEDYK